jgi:hypothetical protein
MKASTLWCGAFIYNVDETGRSDSEDRREIRVLVPAHCDATSVPVDWHTKRSTLTACMGADGFRMRPFVIVSRATAEKDLAYHGYDRHSVALASQGNAFMTPSLFDLWAETAFFPAVKERRRYFRYLGKAVLLSDGLGAHHPDRFLQRCSERNVEVVPPVRTRPRPLDLMAFALLKHRYSSSKFSRLTSAQSNRVVRILGAWFAASAPDHNAEKNTFPTPPPDGPEVDSSIGSHHRTLPNLAQKLQPGTSPLIASHPWHLVLLRLVSSLLLSSLRHISSRRSASHLEVSSYPVMSLLLSSPHRVFSRRSSSPLVASVLGRRFGKVGGHFHDDPGK